MSRATIARAADRRDEREFPLDKAVDDAGKVWRHENPAELYRFIRARNELLGSIGASRRIAGV